LSQQGSTPGQNTQAKKEKRPGCVVCLVELYQCLASLLRFRAPIGTSSVQTNALVKFLHAHTEVFLSSVLHFL
jgi:hypothetical protein